MPLVKNEIALQDQYAPNSICFGCGPANSKGLRIKSKVIHSENADQIEVHAEFVPESFHEAFPGMLNGGIIGALLDCHSNWTAAYTLMKSSHQTEPPCTVTADFHVKLRAPTPSDAPVRLIAKPVETSADRVKVRAELFSGSKLTATCEGLFVAVKPGHPAYHRWG